MHTNTLSSPKRPVNLTLSAGLVTQAKTYTNNLSATMESLLVEFVATQQQAQISRCQAANACADQWNEFLSESGSFADEYSTL